MNSDYPGLSCASCREDREEGETEEPNCRACPIKDSALLSENEKVTRIYELLNTEFVQDFKALELVLGVMVGPVSRRQLEQIIWKLAVLHRFRKLYEEARKGLA